MAILREHKFFLIFLFILSLLVRGLVFGFYLSKENRFWNYDSPPYHSVAIQVSEGNGFLNNDASPHFLRVPGYSFFLAGIYKVFGPDKVKALWLQVFLSSLIPLLVFWLASLFSTVLVAKIAALWTVFHLGFVLFAGLFMTESLFCIFFLLFLIYFLPAFNLFFTKETCSISYKNYFLSGIFLGIASLIRPVGHYLLFVSILLILCSNFILKIRVKLGFVLVFGWLTVVLWWLLRNFLITGYIFFHTLPGLHFLKHGAARVVMEKEQISYSEASGALGKEYGVLCKKEGLKKGRELFEIEACKYGELISVYYFKQNPFISTKLFLENMFKTTFSLYSSDLMFIDSGGQLPSYDKRAFWDKFKRFLFPEKFRIIIYLEILLYLFIVVGFLLGLLKSTIEFNLNTPIKFLAIIGVFLVLSCVCGFARLRLPVEPLVIVLSLNYWFYCKHRLVRLLLPV